VLFRTKTSRRTSQECLRPYEIAELCHRDAAHRQSRRIVAQRDPFQSAQEIARR
jgi:hypothetical protein